MRIHIYLAGIFFTSMLSAEGYLLDSNEVDNQSRQNKTQQQNGQYRGPSKQREPTQYQMEDQSRQRDQHQAAGAMSSEEPSYRFIVSGTFLWYLAEEQFLDYAYSFASGSVSDSTLDLTGGELHYPDFKWKPGFKAGLGILGNAKDPGEIYAQYFWFYQTSKGSISAPSGGDLWLRWLQLGSAADLIAATSASANWRLEMNVADLEFARNYHMRYSNVRPFFGVRGGWIGQKFQVSADGVILEDRESATSFTKSEGWFVGLRAGMNTNCRITHGISWYINGSGSLLPTRYSITRTYSDGPTSESEGLRFSGKTTVNTVCPVSELSSGVAWDSRDSIHDMGIKLSVGYDLAVYWNQNVMRSFTDNGMLGLAAPTAPLNLQGLNVMLSLFF